VKLSAAKVCLECDEVFSKGQKCPACSSTAYSALNIFVPSAIEEREELIEATKIAVIRDPWWWHLPVIGKYFRPFDIAY
jgi:hypothetical protein